MFLSKDFVLKRINAALKKSQAKVRDDLKEARREVAKHPDYRFLQRRVKSLERKLKGYAALDGIPYKPRKGTFEGNTSYGGNWHGNRSGVGTVSCGFDFETGRAHSYEWYCLGKIIKGRYVVNSYYYSSMTRGHQYDLERTLKILGVKYTELEAPKGLQDLDAARELQLSRIGEITVELEHGSKKCSKWRRAYLKRVERDLAKLSQFGIKTTRKMIDDAIETARKNRRTRLERSKKDREWTFQSAYQRAIRDQDLKTIVQLIAKDKRRTDKGLPSLIPELKGA